jgi:phosphonate transport system substrate-binding protein
MRTGHSLPSRVVSLAAMSVLGLLLSACGADTLSVTPTAASGGSETVEQAGKLVIGNIDANNPSEKIAEFQPLVDYLVDHLGEYGIDEGQVVIAQDTAEMTRLLAEGEVDIFIDAAIPSLIVCSTGDCQFAMRQWKGGGPELAGVFVTGKESGISSLDDLRGQVIMLEQPHSTVGHILPLATLAELDIPTRRVNDLGATVAEDEVGYYVATGGQSSMNLLLSGEIGALAIGERALKRFSEDVQAQVEVFATTEAAPSQLVAFRNGLDPALEAEIRQLMISLEESDDGQAILESLRDTARFDEFTAELAGELTELWEVVQLIIQE